MASASSNSTTTSTKGRPRDPGADASILAATFAQLLEVGYGGLSIEAVAIRAGGPE